MFVAVEVQGVGESLVVKNPPRVWWVREALLGPFTAFGAVQLSVGYLLEISLSEKAGQALCRGFHLHDRSKTG